MMEGGIASWKKKEGESFAQGDVLLEIVSALALRAYDAFCGSQGEKVAHACFQPLGNR